MEMIFVVVFGIALSIGLFRIKKFTSGFLSKLYLGCMWGVEIVVSVFHRNLKWVSRNMLLSVMLMVLVPVIILMGNFFITSMSKQKESKGE